MILKEFCKLTDDCDGKNELVIRVGEGYYISARGVVATAMKDLTLEGHYTGDYGDLDSETKQRVPVIILQ